MLRRKETTKTIYEPNQFVKITVDNKPVVDEDSGEIYMYEVGLTLKLKKFNSARPLRFVGNAELKKFIADISLDENENQTSMLNDDCEVEITAVRSED